MKTCKHCHGPLSWYDTRTHCAVCILHALVRWPHMHIYRRRDKIADAKLIAKINREMGLS